MAIEERSPTNEILREAVEQYLESRHATTPTTAADTQAIEKGLAAIAKIRELRKGNMLPEGVTIRDLIDEGRD